MSMKQNFNNAFSKGAKGRTNFLVFGVLAVAIAGAAAFVSKKSSGASDASAQVMKAPDSASSVVDASKASDSYLQTLQESNAQEIEKARKNGTSAVSTLTAKPVRTDGVQTQETPATVIVGQNANGGLPNAPQFTPAQGGTMPIGQSNQQQQQQQQPGMQQNKALAGQVAELLDSWKAPGQSIYSSRGEGAANAAALAATASAVAAVPAAEAPVDPVVLIPAGKILSAVVDTQAVSDDGGPVLVSIVAGPYNTAKLIGSMAVNRNMGKLTFHTMSFKGESISISAVGIDPETGRIGMADEVDKHWFEKYGLVIASSAIGGYGEAAGSVGQTVTQTTGATIVQQDPLSPKLRMQVALGKGGSALAQQLAQDASQVKTTVTINQSKPLGVMFLKDVVSQ